MSWISLYRAALRLLPAELRAKHGSAMEALFVIEVRRAREKGFASAGLAAWTGTWDVVRRGLYERWRGPGSGRAAGLGGARGRDDGGEWTMDTLKQDVAQVAKSLWRAPRFAALVVLTLALGIGANSAIFSVVSAVVLRPLPFPDAARFVHLAWRFSYASSSTMQPIKYEYWRDNTRSFAAMATWRGFLAQVDADGTVAGVPGLRVSHGFLSVLGYTPRLGRDFEADEDVPDGPRVALLGDGLWRARFGGAPDVVGKTLQLDGEPYTIVGVLPETFAFPESQEGAEVIVPMGLRADPKDEGENYTIIARLKDGVDQAQAQADVERLFAPFAAQYPNQVYEGDRGMTLATFQELYVGDLARPLWIAMGAVGLVLLIACANVANLLLARAARRRREVALRAALGASRGRVARFVLVESVLLALLAGVVGLVLARWGVRALVGLTPVELPRMATIGVDWRVMAFTFGAALLTGLVFGAAAALPAARTPLADVLKEGARGSAGRSRGRQILLAGQAALSMMLLVGAGLLIATLVGLRRVDPGFEPDGLVAVRFPFRPAGYRTAEALWELERRVVEELRASPGIVSVAAATNLPLERGVNFPMSIGGRPDDFEGAVEWRAVTPGYFGTLGIELVAGRAFSPTDERGGPPVAIVNEAFVRRWFPDRNPLGERIDIGRYRGAYIDPSLEGPGAEIVGVARDIREISLRTAARRTVYVPSAQAHTGIATALGTMPVFLARAPARGALVERELREALRTVDPELPAPDVIPLRRVFAESLARERFSATLLGAFALLALTLTAFGIYGVLSYTVRQRRREIGIRIALGAGGGAVSRLVAVQGLAPVAVGLALGTVGALALSRVVAGFVWGVSPTDPTNVAVVAAILLAVAVAAAWLPTREAVRTDPVRSLNPD